MGLRCLIVDDNASFLEAAADLLRRQGVAVVGVASSGDEAVERVRELRPDVALVDIKLGAESGLAVARRLADRGVMTAVPPFAALAAVQDKLSAGMISLPHTSSAPGRSDTALISRSASLPP